MKSLSVLLFLLSLVWTGNANLTGRDFTPVDREHKIVELACQAPPQDAFTGDIIDPWNPIYKDYFCPKEAVWTSVNRNIFDGNCNCTFKHARVYVTCHKKWKDGDLLEDVSCDGYEVISFESQCGKGDMIYRCVWNRPNVRDKGYDVVVDFEPFGIYNKGRDILDTGGKGGFYVPENWVCLESISLNHIKDSICCDAVNIRKNMEESINTPEWKRGDNVYPAVYIKNIRFTVKPALSAAKDVSQAEITVYTRSGNLANLEGKPLNFQTGKKGKNENKSYVCYFPATRNTPGRIQSFYQQWEWCIRNIKINETYPRELGELEEEIHIATSTNKIYIILAIPQCPWTIEGDTALWTDVLDLSCQWAYNESKPEAAAKKITRHLYKNIGGSYDKAAKHYSDKCSPNSAFYLATFLENIPKVGKVNCYDMGKALTIFCNALGAGMNFRYCRKFGYLNCIKPIGLGCDCEQDFSNHAFSSIGDRVFDASLKATTRYKPEIPTNCSVWMTNIPWCYYEKIVVKKGPATYPEIIAFKIKE